MKIDANTPPDQLQKYRKSCGVAHIFWLVLGILTFPIGIPLILFGLHYKKEKRKADDLIQQYIHPNTETTHENHFERFMEQRQKSLDEWNRFLEENVVVREIHTKVAGVTFRNEDGTSRQKILADICPGEAVSFEYYEYQGAPAYSVNWCGQQIGNLPADLARDLHDLPDTYTFVGEANEITGGDGLKYGCNLLITLYKQK